MRRYLDIVILVVAYAIGIFCIINTRWCDNAGFAWTISVAIVAGLVGVTMLTWFNHNTRT